MDIMTENLAGVANALTTLIVKETATAIHCKIESVKNEKDKEKLKNTYDEIINQLLSEREEAIRIAQVYKEEFEKVEISDEDIEHLHNTITSILTVVKEMAPQAENIDTFEQLKDLISVDTLKTMQLLGFNYKAAIGDPLTQLCATAINNIGKGKNGVTQRRK